MGELDGLLRDSAEYSREHICDLLTEGLSKLYASDQGAFFGLLYRLDIDEGAVVRALHEPHAMQEVAALVFHRQTEKAALRKRQAPDEPVDPDLKW